MKGSNFLSPRHEFAYPHQGSNARAVEYVQEETWSRRNGWWGTCDIPDAVGLWLPLSLTVGHTGWGWWGVKSNVIWRTTCLVSRVKQCHICWCHSSVPTPETTYFYTVNVALQMSTRLLCPLAAYLATNKARQKYLCSFASWTQQAFEVSAWAWQFLSLVYYCLIYSRPRWQVILTQTDGDPSLVCTRVNSGHTSSLQEAKIISYKF